MSDRDVANQNFAPKITSNISGPSLEIDFEPLNFDIEQLDDEEYQIPQVKELPTLESILSEPDDAYSLSEDFENLQRGNLLEPGSETQSLSSQRSRSGERKRPNLLGGDGGSETLSVASQRSGYGERRRASTGILRHVLLKGISVQLASAAERVEAGTATVVAIGLVLGIGTARGLVLVFDSRQSLRWVLETTDKENGSVSCLSFNADSTRILAGYAKGLIMMFDLTNGNPLRTLTDVHPPNTAVLSVKFTDAPNLALCSDSGGSVFELTFTRTLGMRGCDTRCLFSGSRGEVTTMSPLLLFGLRHPLEDYVITAMATLTKVIIACVRPKLRVILVKPLAGGSVTLPLLSWQLVTVQTRAAKIIDPYLACAKGDTISIFQVSVDSNRKLFVTTIQKIVVGFSLLSCHWMNPWTLALLDEAERLHLIDVWSSEQLEGCDLSGVGLVYESSHFKGIFTGGNVSKAMARAGEKACYNTVVSNSGQLLVLGSKSLHALTIRPWADRLNYLANLGKFADALSLAQSFYDGPKKGLQLRKREAARKHAISILHKYIDNIAVPEDDIPAIVQYAVQFKSLDVLFNSLWETVQMDGGLKGIFLTALEPFILNGQLSSVPPVILQQFVIYYEQTGRFQALEACILRLDIPSLDLHLVMQTCKAHALYDAMIYVLNQAFADYLSPINDLLPIIQKAIAEGRELTGKEVELGNKLLVYISCCLAGRGYPFGDVPKELVQTVKHEVYSCITCIHSNNGDDTELPYPYLRTLLHFDTREFLNVIALAFMEPEFTSELGLTQRQRLVEILLQIMVDSEEFSASEVGTLFTFLARQLSRPGSGLTIPPAKFHPVFDYLTDPGPANKEERQQTMLELLRAAGLQGFPKDRLIERATKAQFYRVCEVIYEQCGEWDQVFCCYLDDPHRRPQVFSFLRNMFVLYHRPEDVSALLDAVQNRIFDLLQLDLNVTGNLIATMMLDRLPSILEKLGDERRLQVLKSVIYQRSNSVEVGLDIITKYLPLFVELTAKIEPARLVSVLNEFLHIADPYEILDVVKVCQHAEGEAFVLFSMGDRDSGLQVLNERINTLLGEITEVQVDDEIWRLVKGAVNMLKHPGTTDQWMNLIDAILCKGTLPNAEKTKLLQMVLPAAAGYSNPSLLLDFLLRHPVYSGATFGDLKHLFTGMLEDSRYEETLAATTLRLVYADLHSQLVNSLKSSRRAVRPTSDGCCVCGAGFVKTSVLVFPCGHPIHEICSKKCQCPVCSTIAIDQVPFPKFSSAKAEEEESPTSPLHLKLAARPVRDLELLSPF